MTPEAVKFVTPLTFQSLTGERVYLDMFDEAGAAEWEIEHVSLAEWADLVLVCPATANLISKAAVGLADDLLSATLLTTRKPVVFVPAMNSGMWNNPILQARVAELKRHGHAFLGPAAGRLACGTSGTGRMVEVEAVLKFVLQMKTHQNREKKC
ncbi:MAG: Coenzyme A biosynthesis bifunctional protein CoaBC [candidate division TA06 bacterium ADurb.Bin417]|uniref:Coenzyme A biosynthesis bifunctional protein CoaBC n=1 Tax=candidate division TA06 bacterium ADurb.Bin417 TaxID=1852828 RepID=A0A1V5M9F8_UNCT6|nr:MAG: Coenzyme A biosynthesis bifunctional protein CoaBC [candidate division TA06 bacterium ADurb.Bin417]